MQSILAEKITNSIEIFVATILDDAEESLEEPCRRTLEVFVGMHKESLESDKEPDGQLWWCSEDQS